MSHSSSPLQSPWFSSIHTLSMMRSTQSAKFTSARISSNGRSIPICFHFSDLSTIHFWKNLPYLRELWTLMRLPGLREKQALVRWCHNRTTTPNKITSNQFLLWPNKTKNWARWKIELVLLLVMSKLTFQTKCLSKKTIYKHQRKDLIRNYKRLQRKSSIVNLVRRLLPKISWQWSKAWTLTK